VIRSAAPRAVHGFVPAYRDPSVRGTAIKIMGPPADWENKDWPEEK